MMSKLTTTEHHILQQIETDKKFFIANNLKNLSTTYHVGDASLVRFVKKMGYTSLKEMQIKYATQVELSNYLNHINHNDTSAEGIINHVYNFEVYSIFETFNLLDFAKLEAAAELILNAKTTIFFGIENSSISAHFLVNNLLKIGINCLMPSSIHGVITLSQFIDPQHTTMVIYCSSGATKEAEEFAKIAHANQIKLIWIKCNETRLSIKNKYLNTASIHIEHSRHRNEHRRFPSITSSSGQFFISNLLFNIILNKYENLNHKLANSDDLVDNWNNH